MAANEDRAYDRAVSGLLDDGLTPEAIYENHEPMREALKRVMKERGLPPIEEQPRRRGSGATVTVPRRTPTLL